jgi:hypothetical protein
MRKSDNLKIAIIPFLFIAILFLASPAKAICPVCTLAVGAGVGLSRYLGVDDAITGLWIGGLVASMIWWTISWLDRKNIKFKFRKMAIIAGYYLLIAAPLYYSEIIGHPLNKIWGIDKLMLGIFIGSLFFFGGGHLHFHHKKKNDDKVYFPFQKVVFSVSPLIILSAIFYFITR